MFPALLGCPDAYQLYLYVCPNCNTQVFSKLEDYFKQHTPEGYISATYKLGRGSGYRTTGTKLQVRIFSNEAELSSDYLYTADTFSKMLSRDPQIVYKAGSKKIISFKEMNANKLKETLTWMRSTEIEELTLARPSGENAASAERKIQPLRFELVAPLDLTVQRVIAKMAFNYFVYCAMPQFDAVVYDNWFSPLRNFVLSPNQRYDPTYLLPTTVVEVSRQIRITYNGSEIPSGHPFHMFRITSEQLWCTPGGFLPPGYYTCLVVYVNLFSLREYRVRLSLFPFNTVLLGTLGARHVVDLAARKFIRVGQDGASLEQNDFRILT